MEYFSACHANLGQNKPRLWVGMSTQHERQCEMFIEKFSMAGRQWSFTLPKFDSSPREKLPKPNKKVVFQPPFVRGKLAVKLQGLKWPFLRHK